MVTAPIKLGLIGVGPWGRVYIKTIAGIDEVQLAHLASRNSNTASFVSSKVKISPDWRDVISDKTLAGVIIATPPKHHAEIACAAIDAGKAVLIEKPMTLDPAEANAIREKAAERHCLVMVEHTHLFRPVFREIKRRAGKLGSLRGLWSSAGDWGPFRSNTPVLWDRGSHEVALALGLWERPPVSIEAQVVECRKTKEGLGANYNLKLDFSDGAIADLCFGNIIDKHRRFAVFFDQSVLAYDDAVSGQLFEYSGQKDIREPRGEYRKISIDQEMPVRIAVKEFASAISKGDFSTVSVEQGMEVVRILSQCQKQIEQ
jgi:predicted dehydrogenase